MKKLKLLAALLALTVGLAGCGAGTASTPDSTPSSKPKKMLDGDNMIASSSAKQEYTEPEDVTYMRLLAGEDEYRACVLYLGGSYEITTDVQQVLDSQQGLRELWGFVYDIPEDHWVTSPEGGCDLYCIFPQEAQATLFVYETSLTDDAENPLQRGKQLYYSEDGQPILGQNKLLEKLNCAHNQLTQLNLDNMSALEELNCFDNQLTVLDVSSSQNLTKLWLGDNHLTSLNLDNNPNLNFSSTDIYSGENVYTVTLNPDRTFDLRNLPGNFDVTRVTGWEYGKANGYILTVDEGTNVVYYAYKCRSDIMEISFKLNVTGTGGSTGGSTGGGSTGGGTVPPVTPPSGGGSTIPPEAGKYQLTVTDGVATVNGSTGAVLNVTPGDTVTLTADTTKFPENEEFGWWEISPYGSVSNTLTGQYQRTATFTMPPENVSARAMSKTAGVSTGGDDGGGAAILLVGGAAVAGLVGYGVYSYVSEQQLKALLPEGVAMPENRAQTALLLWNTAGRPEPAAQPAFPDVADPDTAKAAQWCVEQGLMNAKFRGRFAPDGSSPAYKTLNAYRQLAG